MRPIACMALATALLTSACKTTFYLVRHAETATSTSANTMMSRNPDLSEKGKKRAQDLASLLADKQVAGVFSSELQRSQQTAQPTAVQHQLPVVTYPSTAGAALVDSLATTKNKTYLIVGHSNTIPAMVRHFKVATTMINLPEDSYNQLFIVKIKRFLGRKVTVQETKYGE